MRDFLKDIFRFFFPKGCVACGGEVIGEEFLCVSCSGEIGETKIENIEKNEVSSIFWGRVDVEGAFSLLRFESGGVVQRLIHALKYEGEQEIGVWAGKWYGQRANELGMIDIDVVIVVPIGKSKRRKRGYNQVSEFGKAVAEELGCEYSEDKHLRRREERGSLVGRGWKMRQKNKDAGFEGVNLEELSGKKVLLVDDLITTGKTMCSCVEELTKNGDVQVWVGSIAVVQG